MSSPCLQEGNVVRMIMFANGGGGCAPPNPPAVFKPSMSAIKRKHHVITTFAMRENCAKHFLQMGSCASHRQVCSEGRLCGLRCSRLIFSEYVVLQVLSVNKEWTLRIAAIDSSMIW